jgi:hypothetical protein
LFIDRRKYDLIWKNLPLIRYECMSDDTSVALAIIDPACAKALTSKLKEHQLNVVIAYYAANHEQ